jgi:hypothetical protein
MVEVVRVLAISKIVVGALDLSGARGKSWHGNVSKYRGAGKSDHKKITVERAPELFRLL